MSTLSAPSSSRISCSSMACVPQAPDLPVDTAPTKTLWFMAIASEASPEPCRQLQDCPRAVQRAVDMFDEYAAYGARLVHSCSIATVMPSDL